MEELAQEIRRLKEELDRKSEEIRDLTQWVGRDIDRDYSSPVEELSEKELESYLREHLAAIKIHGESKPDLRAITSHRGTLGKPIAFLKRVLLETTFTHIDAVLDRQTQVNRRIAALVPALLLRARHAIERTQSIEERISGFEESLIILKKKLDHLLSRLERLEGGPTDRPLL
jgi:chromosome segregation ATPase